MRKEISQKVFEKSLSSRDSIISSENHEGRGSVFKEYVDESRMVCSRNYGIVAEYGLLKYFLRDSGVVAK